MLLDSMIINTLVYAVVISLYLEHQFLLDFIVELRTPFLLNCSLKYEA